MEFQADAHEIVFANQLTMAFSGISMVFILLDTRKYLKFAKKIKYKQVVTLCLIQKVQLLPRKKEKSAIRGVFSTQEIRKVGTGTTTRKTVQKTFWFVEQAGDVLECQPLNPNFVPSGPKRKITMDELIAKFSPEPEFYQMSVYPKMRELQQSVRQGGMRIARRVKHFLPNTNIHARSRLMRRKMSAQILVSASPTLNVAKKEKAQNIF